MKKVGRLYRENMIDTLKQGVEKQSSVFLLTYTRVSSPQMSSLRKDLRKHGAKLYVSKNNIARKALVDLKFEGLSEKVGGQTAFVWGETDSSELSKVLTKFSKECDGVTFKGGLLQGAFIGPGDIARLADLPSREVLLAQLLGVLQSPLSRLAGALSGKISELLSVLQQLSDQKGGK